MPRILLLDENAAVRRLLQRMLEAAGHVVFSAADADAGLKLFDVVAPDVVITDLVMAGAEGIETIRALKQRRPHVPIIAMSGSLPAANALGAARTMEKPIIGEDLLCEVAELT